MSRGFEVWVGNRYVRSRSSNSFVSLISAISMLGIAIAVLVLIVVMSVVNGFERELKDRLLAMTAHATIEDINGRLPDVDALVNSRIRSGANAPVADRSGMRYHGNSMVDIDPGSRRGILQPA